MLAPGVEAPLHSDWSHRPALWSVRSAAPGVGPIASAAPVAPDTRLFHDCPAGKVMLTSRTAERPPFAVALTVSGFAGSYLSLAIDLPAAAATGLSKRHLIRVATAIASDAPTRIYARLNIVNGPNTERLTQEVRPETGIAMAEFDLAYCGMDAPRVSRLWLDLILAPQPDCRLTLSDLTLSRRPRAQL